MSLAERKPNVEDIIIKFANILYEARDYLYRFSYGHLASK
jgi:hypothetical protein